MTRVLAIDWSGAAKGAEKAIWLAEARDSRLVRPESGRSRRELVDHLIRQAEEELELVVGLDFAFSLPEWGSSMSGVSTRPEASGGWWSGKERAGSRPVGRPSGAGPAIPYIGHLLGVCSLTLEAGGDEDQAIPALLHDAAEDQGGRETLESIRLRFGNRVAPYNARAILQDCRRLGDRVFERFRPGRRARSGTTARELIDRGRDMASTDVLQLFAKDSAQCVLEGLAGFADVAP